jgi:mycothiol synthase
MMNNSIDLTFRSFAGKSDYPKMAKLLQDIAIADHADFWITAEDIERDYQHLVNSKPETDMCMVEDMHGNLAAYTRVGWNVDDEGWQVFGFPFNIHPDHRSLELNRHLLQWVHQRCKEVAYETQGVGRPIMRAMSRNVDQDLVLIDALEKEGFQPVRFLYRMQRDLSEPIQIPPLPAGLEVRPVPETLYGAAVKAIDEAFQGEWGHAPITQEALQNWLISPQFQPALWQVAWDGDEIAAGVYNYVDEEANKQFDILRGWTDPIFTRRPWRKRGLARALLMRSLQMFKDMGMTEAALGVDTQNPNSALKLYESCGFKMEYRSVVYEKGVLA